MELARLARIEDSSEDGSFRMVLATSGEASDGHILDIAGGIVPERMPLLLSHQNDPRSQIGSVTDAKRDRGTLRARGSIELGGDGAQAEIRRDVFHMIRAGHIGAVSLRWDPIKTVSRSELPASHPARVRKDEADQRKRFGLYFQAWRALEASVVAIGADPAAVIGRSQETTGDVAEFWRTFAPAVNPERTIPLAEHETALARILALEERIAALSRPLVAEPPAAVRENRADIVARMVRDAIAAHETRLEERMRAFVRDTFGRVI